jgi:hypothetical protein
MLRAHDKWPTAQSTALWPYALRLANEALNCTPRSDDSDRSPIELFTGSRVRPNLRHLHHHGCPVYVLKAGLQKAGGYNKKWDPRARIGIYLGPSPRHSRGVSLVLNPRTGLVSPQWHTKHDDLFETVSAHDNEPTHGQWKKLAGLQKVIREESLRRRTTDRPQGASKPTRQNRALNPAPRYEENGVSELTLNQARDDLFTSEDFRDSDELQGPAEFPEFSEVELPQGLMGTPAEPELLAHPPLSQSPLRRSSRVRTPTREMLQSVAQQDLAFAASLEVANNTMYVEDYQAEGMEDPIAFAASKSDPDTMYYHQAMKQPDAKQFRAAMQKEIDDHVKNGHWEMMLKSEVPEGTKILDSVWAMKRKRRIKTREVYKWKGRLNVHGGQMLHGIHYWETFSPVVTWIVIRLVLILSLLLGWHTRQIDFVLAYPQAPAEAPTYMKIPRGVNLTEGNKEDYVLKLVQNLYGGKAAGRIWNRYLHEGLVDLGFTQSKIDECCYYRNGTIFLVYVDDGILAGPSKQEIDLIIEQLGKRYNLTDEGDLTDYLGVNIDHLPDGRIKLSQPHLINQIIEDVNFTDETKSKSTPAASTKILNKDLEGEPHSAEWAYRSVIGKLNFLEKSTRGELGYSVHQAARFCAEPKKSHTDAVNRIVRYLVGTRDEGMILDPTEEVLECYPDADFMGLWNRDTAQTDPSTARSRTGYVIRFCGCPIVWASKLQTEFCLSSTESEYVSLSAALREVLPLIAILEEMKANGIISKTYVPKVFCKLFEDNSGALEMARTPKMRPRTKHINVKYHHFRSAVARKLVELFPIDTLDQLGDLWTKPLSEELFEKFTQEVFGWSITEAMAAHKASMGKGSVQITANPAVSPSVTTMASDVDAKRDVGHPGGRLRSQPKVAGTNLCTVGHLGVRLGSRSKVVGIRLGILRGGSRHNLLLDLRRRGHRVRFVPGTSFRVTQRPKHDRNRRSPYDKAKASGSEWRRVLQTRK